MKLYRFLIENKELIEQNNIQALQTVDVEFYDVLRIERGIPIFFEDHFERFTRTAMLSGKQLWISAGETYLLIKRLIDAEQVEEVNVKMICQFNNNGEQRFEIQLIPVHLPNENDYLIGTHLAFLHEERTNPNAKVYQAQMRKKAQDLIDKNHIYETILVNNQNQITEGSRSNIFFVKNDSLITAPDNVVLQGIMRKKVIEIALENKIELEYKTLTPDEASECDGAFLTGTSPRILPVGKLDDIYFNPLHPVINQLRMLLQQKIERYITSRLQKK